MSKNNGIIHLLFHDEPTNEMERFMKELEEVREDDLEGEPFYGVDLDEERWALYCRLVEPFITLASQGRDRSILKVKYLSAPVAMEKHFTFGIIFPIISNPSLGTRKAIADALTFCDMVVFGASEEKVRMMFSINNMWKGRA